MSKIFKLYKIHVNSNPTWKEFINDMNSSTKYSYLFDILGENELYTRFTPIDILINYEIGKYKTFTTLIKTSKLIMPIKINVISKQPPTQDFLDKVKLRVLYLMPNHINPLTELSITLFRCPIKKRFPQKENARVLGIHEINSGVSTNYMNSNKRTICVFREEEMMKVLCHELIHIYELDKKNKEIKYLETMFDINPGHNINPNEAYVEFLAVCYNTMLSLMEEGKYTQLKFDILINQEIIHNIKQVAKILKYYGYNDIDEFIFPEKLTNRYRENTSILSYFIIKLFILADYKNNMNKSFNSIFYEPKILELFNNNTLKDQINNQMSKCGRIYNTSLKMTLN